ncbi:MAG: hypothetical protein GXO39_01355 [Thermotogae bacterium]|nr:hypothetical protein [Thermotogota bacterium]
MWLYEIFILPADTSQSPPIVTPLHTDSSIRIRGSYSFGSDGVSVSLGGSLYGVSLSLNVEDAAGLSGQVKRIEELQEFNLRLSKGKFHGVGGILTDTLLVGTVKGEGFKLMYGLGSLEYLYRYSPLYRRKIELKKGYSGPYVFSEVPPIRSSLTVYLNGRRLKEEEFIIGEGGNTIHILADYEEGDVLVVEYQSSTIQPSHIFTSSYALGGVSLTLYGETPAAELDGGCIRTGRGDYVRKGDTLILKPGEGYLDCNFVPKSGGGYTFLGDRYVPTENGGYALVPPKIPPSIRAGDLTVRGDKGYSSVILGRVGDSIITSLRWNMEWGERTRIRSFGDLSLGRRLRTTTYNTAPWGGEGFGLIGLGLSHTWKEGRMEGRILSHLAHGPEYGYGFNATWKWFSGEYERFPLRIVYRMGLRIADLELFHRSFWDTTLTYRAIGLKRGSLMAILRRYGDGFLGYELKFKSSLLLLMHSRSPFGSSLLLEFRGNSFGQQLRALLKSSQSLLKQVRFVYVGKGWGDYERDDAGNFYPYPYGSYRREVVYYPQGAPNYDAQISLVGTAFRGNVRAKFKNKLEQYSILSSFFGDKIVKYSINLSLFEDISSSYPSKTSHLLGRIERGVILEVEGRDEAIPTDTLNFVSLFVGYKRGNLESGLEFLRGKGYALAPLVRIAGSLSLKGGYRWYFEPAGSELKYRPPGPFLGVSLNTAPTWGDVIANLSLLSGYDRLRGWYYNLSVRISGSL